MKFLLVPALFLIGFTTHSEEWQKIPIPKPFLECTKDADCEITLELCGCCHFTAMNKRSVRKYAALERYCKEPRPLCKCKAPENTPKCVKKLCTLAPTK